MQHEEGPSDDSQAAARHAGLRYVSDTLPGIRRVRKGSGFVYLDERGKQIRGASELERIRSLVIPPAWRGVWICTHANGHLQATGRDARGRKQYRYHPAFRATRDHTKFDHLTEFADLLPAVRTRVLQDLQLPGLPEPKVIATVVRLLDLTHMRIGNPAYERDNHSYGLTTLHERHVDVHGNAVRFSFRGKSGQQQDVEIFDGRIARIIRQCEELPGHELFQYRDASGAHRTVGSSDVNDYLRDVTRLDITAKDFRTWGGTVHAALTLYRLGEQPTEKERAHCMVCAAEEAAKLLGNRPATCRKYYIDPRIFTAFENALLCQTLDRFLTHPKKRSLTELHPEEKGVQRVLEKLHMERG